jgi:hypothetical protein
MNIQGTLFETQNPQLLIHIVVCSSGLNEKI